MLSSHRLLSCRLRASLLSRSLPSSAPVSTSLPQRRSSLPPRCFSADRNDDPPVSDLLAPTLQPSSRTQEPLSSTAFKGSKPGSRKADKVVAANGTVLDPTLQALLRALRGFPEPLSSDTFVLLDDPEAPHPTTACFDAIRTHHAHLLSALSPAAIRVLLRHLLTTRTESVVLRLIAEFDHPEGVFSLTQRIEFLRALIGLCRTKRKWLTPDEKEVVLLSDEAVASYFTRLWKLVGPAGDLGLGPDELRCVMRALRRSSDALFWDASVVGQLWRGVQQVGHPNPNRQESNARLGVRSIICWLSSPAPPAVHTDSAGLSQPVWSLCLEIWSQLVEWGEIVREDLEGEQADAALPAADQAVLTILASTVRSAVRRYSEAPLNRHATKLFKNACEALEVLLGRPALAGLAQTERLVAQLVEAFLTAVRTDHRAPAPAIVALLVRFSSLPTVSRRWSREGIGEHDYSLYRRTLDTLHGLGRAGVLVQTWLDLLPLINVARAGWPFGRLLGALAELANPLVRADAGRPLNGFRLARLVLQLVKALERETDARLVPSRRQAFRMLVERLDMHQFDWLFREERRFDKDGCELGPVCRHCPELGWANASAICRLWEASWGLTRRVKSAADGEPLPLATLVGVTRLAQRVRTEATVQLLKMAISRFVADRTPALDAQQAKSKYLINPRAKLTDGERTRLIEAHMTVGGELSRKFTSEVFQSFLDERVVPSVEDMRLLHGFLEQIDQTCGRRFWTEKAIQVRGLPWDFSGNKGWEDGKIEIAEKVFGMVASKKQFERSQYQSQNHI